MRPTSKRHGAHTNTSRAESLSARYSRWHAVRASIWRGGGILDQARFGGAPDAPDAAASNYSELRQSASGRGLCAADLPLVPPKRQWLHGTDLVRGAVSLMVAPGGRGKSSWLMTLGLACASNRALLGAHVFGGPLRVLLISAEDPTTEVPSASGLPCSTMG